jgi:hypothetical protein
MLSQELCHSGFLPLVADWIFSDLAGLKILAVLIVDQTDTALLAQPLQHLL